uniref:Uncharacterized protein n=1 Tax=Phytophthora fragariae TaxID=53985 RepID=A0A6A3EPG2_9STRA|nr:hypothetical protein PF009_g14627 [Phytophthora fragariae]
MGTPSSPFGPVRLSCIDTARLQELVRLLVHEHTLGYEQFVHEDQRLVDPTQWKRNAQRDNLQVYCRQQQQRKNSSAGERGSRRRLFRDTEVRTALTEMPTLLLVGTIKGSLADVMYGVLNPTADSMRLKSSYPAGVKKSLRFVAWTGDVAKHKMKFCGPCVSEATNLDARALACDEFGADRPSEHHLNHKNRLTAHLEGLTTSDPNVVVLRPSALSS